MTNETTFFSRVRFIRRFFKKKKSLTWTIFKVFIESVALLFLFWFFGREACGIFAAQPGIKPTLPALKGEVLTIALSIYVPSSSVKLLVS